MNTSCSRLIAVSVFGLALAGASLAQTPAPRTHNSYFFVGDSLSDLGNTFALTGSPPAPYYQGRVSNGPTYAEYFAAGAISKKWGWMAGCTATFNSNADTASQFSVGRQTGF